MKTGKSLLQLAQELTRMKENAKDYIVPTELMRAEVIPSEKPEVSLAFTNGSKQNMLLNNWSGSQVAQYTDIPKSYFDRIKTENPHLLADNINHGLYQNVKLAKTERRNESRLVRSLDGKVRGMLSSRYRVLDAHDMLESVLPVMMQNDMQIISSEITEQRMFIKALSPKLTSDVKKGDAVQYGLTLSTSDVGAGSVRVEPLIYRLVCLNGMISQSAIRKYHVGKNQAESEVFELLSDRTKELTDSAFWAQVRDIVLASLKPENFEREVDKLRLAANEEIKNFDLPRVVELAMRATSVTGEAKKNSILAALASGNEGAGLSKWGLINSFTRAAHNDAFSYEESIELERAGGQILTLPKDQWATIAATA